MLSQKYKQVFILGSGFSKSVSSIMPTLKELTEDLKQLKNDSFFSFLILIELKPNYSNSFL